MASKVLQQLNLSQRPLGQNLFAEHIGDLLDGNPFARLCVGSGTVSEAFLSVRRLRGGQLGKVENIQDKQPQQDHRKHKNIIVATRDESSDVDRMMLNTLNIPDNTVCTLTQLLGDIVPLIHDEILVEHLEHLAAL